MNQDRKITFLWVSGAIFIIAILVNLGVLDFLPNSIITVTRPIFRPVGNAANSLKDSIVTFYSFSSQVQEVGALRREVASLRAENIRLQVQSEENMRLRELLAIRDTLGYETVTAEIITWDPSGANQGATINKGSSSGITEGQAVLDEFGNLAGLIETVYPNNSFVLFITDGQVKIDANIVGRNANGLASGSHGVGMEVGLISQGSTVEHNDVVVTAGISGQIPAGIPIGIVDEVSSNETELFKRVSLIPYAEIKSLKLVVVAVFDRNDD